jgi:hypothetical protein
MKPIGLRFTPPHAAGPGVLAATLKRVYAPLVESYPETWGREQAGWEEFDREVFQNPETVGACTFLTWLDNRLVGFGSYDPRQRPRSGILGHNCILPEFRGRGFGAAQVREILGNKALVAVFGSAAGTYNGKRGLVPENRIEMPAAWKAIAEKGLIKHWQAYTDWAEGCKIIDQDNAAG